MESASRKICVVGLGYVGLPVATEFAQHFQVIGYDTSQKRIQELKNGLDSTREVTLDRLKSPRLKFTDQEIDIAGANFYIITVPTPIDSALQPDLRPILSATKAVSKYLKKGDIVVYESTVYPGLTEEICLPILIENSGLSCPVDFSIGYSPERINPGDKEHTLTKIKKVVSGYDSDTLGIIAEVYGAVIRAGVFKATSIKVAEAAKVIENTQRDVNIALVNELALIFRKLNINTNDVLEAASTKWNFLNFKPGLVGGHCIGVDPYYLTFKAQQEGFFPEVILAGRRLNDSMGKHIGSQVIKQMIHHGNTIKSSIVTVFGLTFKENVPDIRNTKVIDIINELKEYGLIVQVHDPLANPEECYREFGIELSPIEKLLPSHCIVFAVSHDEYKKIPIDTYLRLLMPNGFIVDVKKMLKDKDVKSRDFQYWSL